MPTIARRFRGPDHSGNGGFSCGLVAGELGGTARVTLRQAPPLDRDLTWEARDDSVRLIDGETLIAEGERGEPGPAPDFVPLERAREAAVGFPGDATHAFPDCFTCGPDRAVGDGLRIFTGPVDAGVVAAPWTPHPSLGGRPVVDDPIAWAAMDCAGAWSAGAEAMPAVLGSMTGVVLRAPRIGDEHVVVGAHRGTEGRKIFAATAIYTAEGRLMAHSEQVWIKIDPAQFP